MSKVDYVGGPGTTLGLTGSLSLIVVLLVVVACAIAAIAMSVGAVETPWESAASASRVESLEQTKREANAFEYRLERDAQEFEQLFLTYPVIFIAAGLTFLAMMSTAIGSIAFAIWLRGQQHLDIQIAQSTGAIEAIIRIQYMLEEMEKQDG